MDSKQKNKGQKDVRDAVKDLGKLEARVEPLEEKRGGTVATQGGSVLSIVLRCKNLDGLGVHVIPFDIGAGPGGTTAGGTTAGGTTAGGTTAGGTTAGGTTAGGTTAGGTTAGGTTAGGTTAGGTTAGGTTAGGTPLEAQLSDHLGLVSSSCCLI